jgi:hypothetical protein
LQRVTQPNYISYISNDVPSAVDSRPRLLSVFERKVFDYLDGDQCVLERKPLERGFFQAMDTYREKPALERPLE